MHLLNELKSAFENFKVNKNIQVILHAAVGKK